MDRTQKIAEHVAAIITLLGEDINREGLKRTPERVAKSLEFLTKGYQQNPEKIVNQAIYNVQMSEMVLIKNIELYSMCEHHLLPFIGQCHIAYLPRNKVLGISKVARIVDIFARRLQIQELLTQQIADAIMKITDATGAGVIIEAKHLCMMMRGVEKQNSVMTTSVMRGEFLNNQPTRSEFLRLCKP